MATETSNNGWHLSRTFWINLIAGIIAVFGIVDENLIRAIGITDTTKWVAIMAFIVAVLNILERMLKDNSDTPATS